jgi:alkyldihydroxyacetonephosphate synthase
MKWWGWGEEGLAFTHRDKPALAPFIQQSIGVDVRVNGAAPINFDRLRIPEPNLPAELRGELERTVGEGSVSSDPLDRVVHSRGKSLRDLIRQRQGELARLPDVIVRPADEDEVSATVQAALLADAVMIPFGGGSSISGSLEAQTGESRPVISVDLERLDQVLDIDAGSRLARVQAGVFGHFPDSFPHSTLGGWIATRSSGMQSDRYGDIADMVKGLRVVTPAGLLVTRPVPAASNGPSVREMVLGSEGRLGIITEATVHVRRIPERRTILGYLFPTWTDGLEAMRDLAGSEYSASVTRVSDANETQFSFAMRVNPTTVDKLQSVALQNYLRRRRGFDPKQMCLSFIGYEGSERHVAAQRRAVGRLVKRHGGLCVGSGPGVLYDQKKFDIPGDVSETATTWSNLMPLYNAVTAAANRAFAELDVQGYVMCHLSHSYHAGACLYFTFAFGATTDDSMLAEYEVVKSAIQQAFVDNGATLSHHHAVGTEHAQWLLEDISAPGVAMLGALFDGFDPGRHLNPGKIV